VTPDCSTPGAGRVAMRSPSPAWAIASRVSTSPPELIAVARQRPGAAAVGFEVGDLTHPAVGSPYAAVLCRGVLNDVLDDEPRRDAFDAFAQSLERDGVLLLDVRDWAATARRRSRDPIHERTVETPRGRLVYRGEVRLDHARRRMLVAERHTLTTDGGTMSGRCRRTTTSSCAAGRRASSMSGWPARGSSRSSFGAPTIRPSRSDRRTGSWPSPHDPERASTTIARIAS
jgi:hypothetical protein